MTYRSRPDVAHHLSAGVWTYEKAEHELATYEDAAFDQPGDELVLLVETQDTTKVVGEVGLVWLDDPPQTAQVGYVFDPESGGQGFATEAVAALVHAAFDGFDFNLVVAKTDEANAPSRALCERIGMKLLSTSESSDGRAVMECVYGVNRSQNAARWGIPARERRTSPPASESRRSEASVSVSLSGRRTVAGTRPQITETGKRRW
jgi:RimJ/RimL family protein N-acetyltransferase